jgi:hypothetical protein
MNTMPGLTAEASLYKTNEHYHMTESLIASVRDVAPQLIKLGGGGRAHV